MRIRSIQIHNFRNIEGLDLEVKPSVNILYGQNAQGKTNILESIYLCACARSHRTSKDRELIMHGKTNYKVRLLLSSDYEDVEYESVSLMFFDDNDPSISTQRAKRVAEHNDVPVDRISRYIGIFNAVIFAPEDMLLIKEGPSVRRRYMDLLISQVRPRYFYSLQRYSKFIQQRNRTLKLLRSVKKSRILSAEEESELEIWDFSMAKIAAEIVAERLAFSERIAQLALKHHKRISDESENLVVRYRPVGGLSAELETDRGNETVQETIEKHLISRWKASHQEDFDKGLTTTGPHRDDLELTLNGEGLRPFASQGQQRSAALALKLAELDILREETKESPVLLLDDVFSELDVQRRTALLSGLGHAQVFITCTDKAFVSKEIIPLCPNLFTEENSFSFFRVQNGTVTAEPEDDEKMIRKSHKRR
ncbi:MAG: DNA replication/repair protein RecF [Clostridiales bacterium]|nr:DNA replication/repair protein RecF [Clostridiales bacterium]